MAPRRLSLLTLLVLLTPLLACTDECTVDGDCPSDQLCTNGACQRKPPPVPPTPPPPPGVDAGVRDMGQRDATGEDAAPDTGLNPDAGPDAGDVGVPDGAMAGEASATIVVGEYIWLPGPRVDVYAELLDRSGATYTTTEQTFADAEGGSCVLRTRRPAGGAEIPVPAQRIVLTKGAQVRQLEPVPGRPGRFEPTAWAADFVTQDEIIVSFVSTGGAGSVSSQSLPPIVGPEGLFPTMPALGQGVILGAGIVFAWTTVGGSAQVVVELFDGGRTAVLRCGPTNNDGSYVVPMNAVTAWQNENAPAPRYLELRTDETLSIPLTLEGTARTLPATVRLSHGARYEVQ